MIEITAKSPLTCWDLQRLLERAECNDIDFDTQVDIRFVTTGTDDRCTIDGFPMPIGYVVLSVKKVDE